MPTAVICSLFAGICAVTEFHYSIDYSFLHWSDKWTFAGVSIFYFIINYKKLLLKKIKKFKNLFSHFQNVYFAIFRLMQQRYRFCMQLLHLHYINWKPMNFSKNCNS
ncbi:unnamed protein product [Brugia timori]|uniref:PAP2_C domain-containing protein n=1 Tax=Brugia timori TaxID=42155 RepID=A0A0R3QT33_9BILA|nr:unnamed protein product [Brugia timori]